MLKIFKYFRPIDWVGAFLIVSLTAFSVLLDLRLPEYMSELVTLITDRTASSSQIWSVGLKMLGVALLSTVVTIVLTYGAAKIASGLAARLRLNIFKTVGSFSNAEMNKFTTASLITRSTNDVSQVQQVVTMMLRIMLYAPIMAITAVVKIVKKSTELSSVTGIALGVMIALIVVMFILVVPKFKKIQQQTDELNNITRENLTGIRVIRANNAEETQEDKFENVNNRVTKTILYVNRVQSFMMPGMSFIQSALSLTIVWLGSYLMSQAVIDYSTIYLFSQYAVHVLMSFLIISVIFITLPRGMVSARRITEVLDTKPSILDGNSEKGERSGEVVFENVSFKYPDAEDYILENINFTAKAGQTIAFIGSTGSGKSTLINLVPRLYDVTSGKVFVNGQDVKDYKISDLNNIIGYVPQKAVLFSGTLRENVTYGKNNASDEDVIEALNIAQASSLVERLEGGLDYYISQGGKNVSGGQRQRISIARAVIKKPDIYIFDDSFSALDYSTDKKLRMALQKHTKDATKLIVAQRIGTIMDADQIIVLDKGKIVGQGKHKELLENCEVYKEIAYSQLSKEELK